MDATRKEEVNGLLTLLDTPRLAYPDSKAREEARALLQNLPRDAAEDLITDVIESRPDRQSGSVCLKLGALCSPVAVRPLVSHLLSDDSEMMRIACAWALMYIGDPAAVEALTGALADPSERVVRLAVCALSKIAQSKAISPLLCLLDHQSWNVRLQAAVALMEMRVKEPRILSVLEDLANASEATEHDAMVEGTEDLEPLEGESQSRGTLRTMDDLIHEARMLLE